MDAEGRLPVGPDRDEPAPDGDRCLGFAFAEAATPADVKKALTAASQRLRAVI